MKKMISKKIKCVPFFEIFLQMKEVLLWFSLQWIFFKRWENQTTWPASWETCMQIRKQELELDMEQQTSFK